MSYVALLVLLSICPIPAKGGKKWIERKRRQAKICIARGLLLLCPCKDGTRCLFYVFLVARILAFSCNQFLYPFFCLSSFQSQDMHFVQIMYFSFL